MFGEFMGRNSPTAIARLPAALMLLGLVAPCALRAQAPASIGPAGARAEETETPKAEPAVVEVGDSLYYRPAYFAAARPQTALDLVQLVPGFTIAGGVSGRGLEGAASNVLIDGRALPGKGEPVASVLAKIPASSVVGIYRVRTPTPGIDMQGFDEVLVVYRFPRSEAGGTATLSLGKSGGATSRSLGLTGTKGRPGRALSGSANYARSDGGNASRLVDAEGVVVEVGSDSRTVSKGGSMNADLKLGASTDVRGDVSANRSNLSSTQRRTRAGSPTLEIASSARSRSTKASARIDRRFGSTWSASFDGVRSDNRSTSSSRSMGASAASEFTSASDLSETAAGLTLRWAPQGAWRAEGTLDYAHNRLDSASGFAAGGAAPLPASDITVTEARWGAAARLGWAPQGDWSGQLRLRFNHAVITGSGDIADRRSFDELKPELNVTGKLGGFELDVRFAREIDQFAFSAFTASAALDDGVVTLGNPRIAPERRWAARTSLRRSVLDKGQVSLTLEAERIDNPIELVRQKAGFDARDNVDRALRVTANAQASLPLESVGIDGAQLDLNASLGFSEVNDPTTGEQRSLSGERERSFSLGFRHALQAVPLTYGVTASHSTRAPSYRSDEIDFNRTGPSLTGFAEYRITPKLGVRGQAGWTGPGRYERLLFAGSRASTDPIARQVQTSPGLASAQVSLRIEI